MNKKFWIPFILIDIVIIVSGIFWFLHNRDEHHKDEVHYHAGFQVYVDNQKQDFSDFKYMKIEPCGTDHSQGDEQLEKAHLHDSVGDVVHVHRNGATWGDLFLNIKYPLDANVTGYVNGQLTPQILTMPIIANASVVFLVGENIDIPEKITARVSQEHIAEVEKKSENCGDN